MSTDHSKPLSSFLAGFAMISLWRFLTMDAINSRFRRSFLGLGWLVINALAFALGAGFLWASIFQIEPGEFVPYIGLGFAIWGFVAAMLVEGCDIVFASSAYTKQLPIPYSVFIVRSVMVQSFYFAVAFVATIFASIALGLELTWNALWALPGIAIMLWIGLSVAIILSFVGARFRDLSHGISSLLQLLFVLTPIIYPASILETRGFAWVTQFNPIASLLDLIRVPIIEGRLADAYDYIFLGAVGVVLSVLAFLSVTTLAKRTIFWL